jgi:hypothetical protein
VGLVGISLASFGGSIWTAKGKDPDRKTLIFRSKMFPFLQLGGEYNYSVTKNFSMGLSYIFNMGRVRLYRLDLSKTKTKSKKESASIVSSVIGCYKGECPTPNDAATRDDYSTRDYSDEVLSKLRQSGLNYRSKRVVFSEIMALFRYTIHTSR